MREGLFIFLYGALFLLGLFLTPFWAVLARKRAIRIAGRWTLRSDRYYVLAMAIAVLCAGDVLVFGARAWGNLTYGLSPILRNGTDAVLIGVGLSTVLVGKAMLVWLADLEREPAIWTWSRWGAIATVAWGAAVVVLELVR
jgi:hypothetical protein